MKREKLLDEVVHLAREAGEAILEIYRGDIAVRAKEDSSPVTLADERAEALILAGLAALTPDIPVIAEELAAAGNLPDLTAGRPFWLVDPLDGTKEFIKRNGEFTVNVALIEQGEPVMGVVLAPAIGRLFAACGPDTAFAQESGSARRPIVTRKAPEAGLTVVSSRSHANDQLLTEFLAGRPVGARASAGSSLKFCLVAAGEADLYPRFGRTMEWDIAAGHAVLRAAGGEVVTVDGKPMRYGKAGFENPHFIALGSRNLEQL